MPRTLLPSPNEEAYILEQAKLRQKRERLIATRKQSTDWCKRKTNDHMAHCRKQNLCNKLQDTRSKIKTLDDKENELKSKLDSALSSLGKGNTDANQINNMQLDKKKASTLAEFSRKAAERHEIALNQLIAAKEQKLQNEAYVIKLKTEARKKEDEHTKRLLQNPPKSSQPLVEIPKAVENRPLHGGLDAFNKTYYHLPTDIGVVEELSMGDKSVKDAKALAEEVENVMNECRLKLQESKQARDERADVRGSAALHKVQLKNVLEDVTSQLDKYCIYSRTKKKLSSRQTNVFASNLARENTLKQHQVDLEHAVEDIFDKHNQVLDMVLPSSHKFETTATESILETIEETSEFSSRSTSPKQNETEVMNDTAISDKTLENTDDSAKVRTNEVSEDELGDESRPSVKLYFPLHSDASLAQSSEEEAAARLEDKSHDIEDIVKQSCDITEDIADEFTIADDAENDTLQLRQPHMSTSAVDLDHSLVDTIVMDESNYIGSSQGTEESLDLSKLIRDQLEINAELKGLCRPLNTTVEEAEKEDVYQPPPISYTSPTSQSNTSYSNTTHSSTSHTNTSPSTSSFEEIIQELLSSSSEQSANNSSKLSDSISQHTLSQNSSVVNQKLTPPSESVVSRDSSVSRDPSVSRDQQWLEQSRGQFPRSVAHEGSLVKLNDRGEEHSIVSKQGYLKSSPNSSSLSITSKVSTGSKASVSSSLSNLQNRLVRINSQLSEIERIKENDAVFYR